MGGDAASEGDVVLATTLFSGDVVATWQQSYVRLDFSYRLVNGAAVWCCSEAV
jgi:hypothetical protein